MDESEAYPKECDRQTTSIASSSTTSVHVTALDGLVNVNSLFTIAVFVGLSLTTPGQQSLENRACDADIDVAKKLLVFEVVSFSFFLFSSLVAQGLKLAINLLNSKDVDEVFRAHINLKVLRFGMMGSAIGSVMGCVFLVLSMVNVIEIRLGMLSCGSKSTVHAVATLVVLVSSALLVYISTAVLIMDPSDSGNADYWEEMACWWFFFGMFYLQIKKRQRAIRYNSILTGDDRVTEFLQGHWERIFNRTRMTRDCFVRLSSIMEQTGRLAPSRAVSVEEQLMIFLFVVGHGASNRNAQETWQRSGSTISKYFGLVLEALFSMSGEYIRPPNMNDVHHTIRYNNRFYPYFQGCVGAIDGTHVSACVGGALADKFRGRKGDTTWNVLAACDFDLKFTYMLSGWEGSAHDARVLDHAISEPQNGFPFPPPGKYYLVDSGYANRGCFLSPYRGTNYHLRDRRRVGGDRKKEQFNYRHASLRNAIERTFGIWKKRFPILRSMHQFPLDKQAMIPVACAVLHNFIRMDPASVAQDHVVGDEDDDDASSEEDGVDAVPDGVDVGESSSQANIPHDMDMGAFRDYITDCIHEGTSG